MICKRMRQSNKYKGKCNYISDGEKHIVRFLSGGLEDQSKRFHVSRSQVGMVRYVLLFKRLVWEAWRCENRETVDSKSKSRDLKGQSSEEGGGGEWAKRIRQRDMDWQSSLVLSA